MKKRVNFLTLAVMVGVFAMGVPAQAQEEEPAPPAENPGSEGPVTHGEAAVLLAYRLNYSRQTVRPLTALEAIKLLTENGIRPFGEWRTDAVLTENDLARVLVIALGKLHEIPEEERDNPESNAFRELLMRDHNIDTSQIRPALAGIPSDRRPRGRDYLTDGTSTDPLRRLEWWLEEVVPSPGAGRSERLDSEVDDTTPSEPTP